MRPHEETPMARHITFAAIALASCALAALAAGCAAERTAPRDDYVRLLESKNAALQTDLDAARRQAAALKAGGAAPAPPPAPEDPFRAVAVRFGKTTGGLNTDGRPGDERLKVVLEPVDADGDVVKRAGRLDLEALEPAAAGAQPQAYHRWTFSERDLAQTWIGMLGTRAYVLKFDWPDGRPPRGGSLALVARFTTLDGRTLTAETTVPVTAP
jgi:outer membrane murein-binding lipoprotein Lpp